MSRIHRADLNSLIERIHLESSISIRYVRTTEQLADVWTTGALTPIQWKSLMRLFDIHPPSDVSVDRSLSESLCSAVSQKTPLAMSNANSSQRDFKSGLRGVRLEDSSHGVRSAWRNPMLHSSRHTWVKPIRSSDRGGAESDAFCHESELEGRKRHKESLYRSSVDKLRKESSLFRDPTPEKGDGGVRNGAQVLRRSVHPGRFCRKPRGLNRRERPLVRR